MNIKHRSRVKKTVRLNLFSHKDEAQKVFVKNFQTVRSVKDLLCKIGKKNSSKRKVDSGQLQTVRANRISSVYSWADMNVKKVTLCQAKVQEKLKIWQEYLAALFTKRNVRVQALRCRKTHRCLILIVRKCYETLLSKRFCREDKNYGFSGEKITRRTRWAVVKWLT